jgi:hypothetical protein
VKLVPPLVLHQANNTNPDEVWLIIVVETHRSK